MNKLIKFLSITTILSLPLAFSHSLSAAAPQPCHVVQWSGSTGGCTIIPYAGPQIDLSQCTIGNQTYPIRTTDGELIAPDKFLVTAYCCGNFKIHTNYINLIEKNLVGYDKDGAAKLIQGQEITIDFLQRSNLINVCFANAEACAKNSTLIENLMSEYIPVFNNYPNVYINMANDILKNVTIENAKEIGTMLAILISIESKFKESHNFASAFMLSATTIASDLTLDLFDNSSISTTQTPYIFNKISLLVQLAIRKRLRLYLAEDDFTNFKGIETALNLRSVSKPEFTATVLNTLNDNDIITFTMCETRELLKAIESVKNNMAAPNAQ